MRGYGRLHGIVFRDGHARLPDLPPSVILTWDERDARGPLEGLRAGMKALPAGADAAYVTSCDVPLLAPAFVERMADLLGDHDIAVMGDRRLQAPVVCGISPNNASAHRIATVAGSSSAGVPL